ncbi:TetR family transcriptional regulator [Streptomyces sp. NPDC002577]
MSDGPPARRRDAARSRELLLQAARELFAERGFDRTTTRDIGERAGVDPALIARYFGNKTHLYVATLQHPTDDAAPADLLDPARLLEVFERVDRGPGPITQVAVQPYSDPAAQDAARAALHARMVEPLLERFTREGLDRPRLRAEIVVAALIGVLLGRRSGAFDELGQAGPDDLITLLRDSLTGET